MTNELKKQMILISGMLGTMTWSDKQAFRKNLEEEGTEDKFDTLIGRFCEEVTDEEETRQFVFKLTADLVKEAIEIANSEEDNKKCCRRSYVQNVAD